MQLSPNENYPIFHGIINHLDTATYYVRTVIYDADYNLLATVDLEDQGSQNFLKMWKVPYDNVFQKGKFILLVTSTYTDSSYTTKSENYGDEFQTHLVQERWNMATMASLGGGSSSYSGITASDVRKVIKKELENIKFPEVEEIKFPKQKEYEANFKDITKGLTDIKVLVDGLPTRNNDLSPLIGKLDKAIDEVKRKPVTRETDIKPILKEIKKSIESNEKTSSKLIEKVNTNFDTAGNKISKKIEDIVVKELPKVLKEEVKKINLSVPMSALQPKKDERPDERTKNINKLKSKFGIK